MRIFYILMLLVISSILFSQISIYGEYKNSVTVVIPDGEEFHSPINPDNILGLKDIEMGHSLINRLTSSDELADFELWFSLNSYPIGQLLYGTVSSDLISSIGDRIDSFELQRAVISWYFSDDVRVKVGRQSMLTGYGYGWNPIDFANPLKNPQDPDRETRGVDAVLIHLFPYSVVNLKLYSIVEEELLSSGVNFDELYWGGELTAGIGVIESKLTGFLEFDDTNGEDARVNALGLGFISDISGVGVYGEGALLSGSRVYLSDGAGGLKRDNDIVLSGLLGLEYTSDFELSIVAEYYYNGEGFNRSEREKYFNALESLGYSLDSNHYSMFRLGKFSRQYLLMNLFYPLYDYYIDLGLTGIYALDSGALTLIPSIIWSPSGAFSIELSYTGLNSLKDNSFSEYDLTPMKHVISLSLTFNY